MSAPEAVAPTIAAAGEPPADWDAYVREAPGGTFCHLSAWHDVMEDVLGHTTTWVTARDAGGALVGVLPLVRVRSFLFGHYLVSVPFLNYGGPLGGAGARRALTEWARDEASRSGAEVLEIRSRGAAFGRPAATDQAELEEAAALPAGLSMTWRKLTVVLPLPEDPEELWSNGFRAKLRSQIKRPMKEGLEARFGPAEVGPFYEIFAENMRDLGTPVLPRSLFESFPRLFGDSVVFATVYGDDGPIAAGCGFLFGGEFELTWASSLRRYNRLAPNMLLYWRLMEHAIERGVGAFNFGRCTPGGGTHKFKRQWGGADEPLPWSVWTPDADGALPSPDQGKYELAASVWRRLPVPVTRVLGPPLARRIP